MIDPHDCDAISPALSPGPRERVIAFARTLADLSANPAHTDERARYLELVAPGEDAARADEMASMSGCALTQRAILRRFIAHPILEAAYVTGQAMADLVKISTEANGTHGGRYEPLPGDIVIVGGGVDGGGPEHTWMMLDDGTGLDGGQRDGQGFQRILIKPHALINGRDGARLVRYVLDVEAILGRFGR